MSIPKVYLAKSNRANPDVVSRVRQTLSKFQIQIVEFTGGQFSHSPMMECNQLVVVPDLDSEEIVIGKGLYGQITKFGSNKGFEYVFVISDGEDLIVKEINEIDIVDYDDYIEHAVIEFTRDNGDKLMSCFEDIYGVFATGSSCSSLNSNSNYYQLIGRK